MGRITEISPQVKDKKRVNVYIDGAFKCGLSLETAAKFRLKAGVEIDEERLKEIEFDSERQAALEKAAAHISKTMKTERELSLFLSRKGYGDAVVSFILEKFKSYGYIDDAAYAKSYVTAHSAKKGARLIKAELRARGVGEEIVADALKELDGGNAAKAAAAKYMRGKGREAKDIQKLYRHLLGRGFSYEEAAAAAEEYKECREF
ncbi:MAG: hypothetical protein DBX59_05560 [Bacillota bacterium]|nr:MAG: hypothetical protein DBX59_05560 [Bacillota bacterium]